MLAILTELIAMVFLKRYPLKINSSTATVGKRIYIPYIILLKFTSSVILNVSPEYNILKYFAIKKAKAPMIIPKGKYAIFLSFKFKPISFKDFLSDLYKNQVAVIKKITEANGKYCFIIPLLTNPLKNSEKPKRRIAIKNL